MAFGFSEKWPSDGCTRWLTDGEVLCISVSKLAHIFLEYLSSSEGSIRRLDNIGQIQDEYNFEHISLIHDMEPTAGGDRIVVVGETLVRSDRSAGAESAILREY